MISVISIALLAIIALYVNGYFYTYRMIRKYPATGAFCHIGAAKIHYLDLGKTHSELPPIVLIHGVSSSALDMKEALGFFCEQRRLIIIDRPGYGYSSRPKTIACLEDQADLIAGLLEALSIKKPIILGHSYGGAVALNYALHHPDRLSGLLLLAPPSHRWPGGVAAYNHLATTPAIGWLFRHTILPCYGMFLGRKAVESAFWPAKAPLGYFEKAAMPLIFRSSAFHASAQDITGLYGEVIKMEPEYQRITCPVRMLAGTHDTAVLSTIHCMSLKRDIKGAQLRYVPEIGHPVHHGAKQEIAEELMQLDQQIMTRARKPLASA